VVWNLATNEYANVINQMMGIGGGEGGFEPTVRLHAQRFSRQFSGWNIVERRVAKVGRFACFSP
jgi:hypothetical protein